MDSSMKRDIEAIAVRHGFSAEAAQAMWSAMVRGNGSMAQFNHPEFAGFGQWMRGGMTMVGDMFDSSLKSRVDALCNDLSRLHADHPVSAGLMSGTSQSPANWWPEELGMPGSSGGQNSMRYAYFPQTRRLAIDENGQVSIYDTLDHRIGGVSQQQSSATSLTFTSQHGPVNVSELPLVGAGAPRR
jgi:hypothetical protein